MQAIVRRTGAGRQREFSSRIADQSSAIQLQRFSFSVSASAIQQIDRYGVVSDAEVAGERGVLSLDGEEHLPGDLAIAEVTCRAAAQLGDVLGFGEVHLEERADARGEREQVQCGLGGLGNGADSERAAGSEGLVAGGLITGQRARLGEQEDMVAEVSGVRGFVAVERGEVLNDLGAAAMAVHVAKAADVHEDVKAEGVAGVEGAQGFVVSAAMAEAKGDVFRDAGGGELGDAVADLAIGMVAGGVEEGRGQLDFEGFGAFDQIDEGSCGDGLASEQLCGGLGQLGAGLLFVGVGLGVFDQGWGGVNGPREQGFGFAGKLGAERVNAFPEARSGVALNIPGWPGGGVAELDAEVANLGKGAGEQTSDLGFEGAGVDDLAERGVGGEREQVAGNVKGACLEGARIGLVREGLGLGDAHLERLEDGGGGFSVGGEKAINGARVKLLCRARSWLGIRAEIGLIAAGFLEVLVARGALLAVPALLVDEDNGGQQREPFDGEGNVGEVGDGAVAVLEVEGVEELLGALGADLGQRLPHGKRRAGVFRHGVGEDLRIGPVNGENVGLLGGRLGIRIGGLAGHGWIMSSRWIVLPGWIVSLATRIPDRSRGVAEAELTNWILLWNT